MDQTDSLMVLIPSKARDQGLPAQIPCCHLDLGPIPDLRPRDPSPPASLTSHHLPPHCSPQSPTPSFHMRTDWKRRLKRVNNVSQEQFLGPVLRTVCRFDICSPCGYHSVSGEAAEGGGPLTAVSHRSVG